MTGADEFGRLERRVAALNFVILASLAAALGLVASALLAASQPDSAAELGGRPALPARLPVAEVVPRPAAPAVAQMSAAASAPLAATPEAPAAAPAPAHTVVPKVSAEPAMPLPARVCPAAGWYVQLGALRGTAHVRDLAAQGREHGYAICTAVTHGLTLVLAGPYRDGHEAVRARDRLKQALGIQGFLRRDGR